MTDINDNIDKEERALEAMLAAAFKLDFPEEISDEEAEKFFKQPVRLSKEDEEAVDSWGIDFVDKLIEGEKIVSDKHDKDITVNKELELEISAMNRDKNGEGIDEKARRKIDEERKKTLEEEENKDNKQDGES